MTDQRESAENQSSTFRRLLVLVVFVLFFNAFFFHRWGAGSFILQTIGFFLFLIGIFIDKTKSLGKTLLGFTFLFTLTSAVLILRSNPFVSIIYSLATLGSFVLLTYLLASTIPFFRSLLELTLSPLFLLFSYIGSGLHTFGWFLTGGVLELFSNGKGERNLLVRVKPLIIGLILGIPVAIILISMFSGADPIFATTIKKLFDLKFLNNIPARIILSGMLFVFLSPFIFLKRDKEFRSPIAKLEKMHLVHEMTVVMTLVSIVLASFLFIQWPYVFAKVAYETDLSKFGVATYSEYVKRGFVELIQIAAFIYGLIWAGLISLRGKREGQKTILPLMQGIVLALFSLFLLSIFRRIWLYQAYHGWSLVRIYGGFFLLWISGITFTLFARHFWMKKWVTAETLFSVFILMVVGMFNAEDFIVQNHPPTVNKRIDYIYLSNMSPDGYRGWQKALQYTEDILTKRNYQSKAFINREERREVAYAGIVLGNLTRNYHVLMTEYGHKDEQRVHLKAVLLYERQENEIDKQFLENVTQIPKNEVLSHRQYAQERGRKIEELVQKVDDTNADIDTISQDIFIIPPFNRVSFQRYTVVPNFFEVSFEHDQQFIALPPKTTIRKRTSLDSLYIFNTSKIEVLRRMRYDMPIEHLLQVQKEYVTLFRKIASQPENERDYDTDISFNTPFLMPW